MFLKKLWKALVVCVAVIGCLLTTGFASVHDDGILYMEELNGSVMDNIIMECSVARASGSLNVNILPNSGVTINGYFTLAVNDSVKFDCSYTPKSASVDFGVIAPDGLFYGISGTNGSINQSLRVNQRGSYTLAIVNNSAYTVTVTGEVTY